jgi:hypothetical protein
MVQFTMDSSNGKHKQTSPDRRWRNFLYPLPGGHGLPRKTPNNLENRFKKMLGKF